MTAIHKTGEATKKLTNSAQTCAAESRAGLLSWNPGLVTLPRFSNVVLRHDWLSRAEEGKVAVITGGGSGHEPSFAGFVGEGMATAAVHGDLFAAPSSKSILATLLALGQKSKSGILVIFNNYTGDRLNFGTAVEKARVRGVTIEVVVNSDDCAVVSGSKSRQRRGLAGLILLLKIVGHMADAGEDLEKIADCAREATHQTATMGVAWSSCSLPGGSALFQLGQNEMELGVGMHGEAGIKRIKMLTARDTASLLISYMTCKDLCPSFIDIKKGSRVVLLLNNMGSTSDLEMNIFAREILRKLGELEASVDRMYVGRYMTSLEMAGVTVTIMMTDDVRNECFDSRTSVLSWVVPVVKKGFTGSSVQVPSSCGANSEQGLPDDGCNDNDGSDNDDPVEKKEREVGPILKEAGHKILLKALTSVCNALIANSDLLNFWDSAAGDGDCGNTFATGARAIFKILHNGVLTHVTRVCAIVDILSEVVESSMGGTSGGLYSLFLTAVSQEMATESENLDSHLWARAMRKGIEAIMRHSGAEPGHRTMIDPLNAACTLLEREADRMDVLTLWQQALKVAELEMKKTKDMPALAGRSSNVNPANLIHPDPGAKACCVWMSAIVNVLLDNKKLLQATPFSCS